MTRDKDSDQGQSLPASASASYLRWLETGFHKERWAILRNSELGPTLPGASTRLLSLLLNARITSKEQLRQISHNDLLRMPNVGRRTIAQFDRFRNQDKFRQQSEQQSQQPQQSPVQLNYDDKVHFVPFTPRYGRAEFHFCHQFIRGKLKCVYITRDQQPGVEPREYVVACHGDNRFRVFSWTHKGIGPPDIWLQYWCREHNAFGLRVYVPRNADHFWVGSNDIVFDNKESYEGNRP